MNPWQSLRREFGGAFRSLRYDVAARKARRVMNAETMVLPVLGAPPPGAGRRRMYRVVAATLVPLAGVSGYLAVNSGLGALLPGGDAPANLPGTNVNGGRPSQAPQPAGETVKAGTVVKRAPSHPPRATDVPIPSFSPPVPTPAPTCDCPSPSPSPTVSPSRPPTPSPSLSPSPTLTTPTESPKPSPGSTSALTSDASR